MTPSPPGGPAPPQASGSNLAQRVVSSLVLAPVAIAVAWFGGPLFVAFWAIAALVVLWEWIINLSRKAAAARWSLAHGRRPLRGRACWLAPLVLRADPASRVLAPSSSCSPSSGRPTSGPISPAVRSAGRSSGRRSVRKRPGPARSVARSWRSSPVLRSRSTCRPSARRRGGGRARLVDRVADWAICSNPR